ncbi:MAG: SHOCT domain-containing protein [Phascolarctobacterium sp.]|nr:SHOCT domain-containing protein [Phascolarctobacterium sp.]
MGLFDKMKNAANAAKGSIVNVVETTKANYEQKKAEEAAYRQEMYEKAEHHRKEICDAIYNYSNDGSFFRNTTREELLNFTKEFYDKIFMPANSVSKTRVAMYPYITEKQLENFKKIVVDYNNTETALMYFKAEDKKEFVLTDEALYFAMPLIEDNKYFAQGRIPCDEISKITIVEEAQLFFLKCDEYTLSTLIADKATKEDLITLNNYFTCIVNHDFVITDEEVDKLIQEKIGKDIYDEVKKYMIYDDELLVYFAWGLDSITAKDYVVCTNKQIIVIDREVLGATANIKQFYYENITSASVEQNSKSDDLFSAALETFITAATKTCDLIISVAGASNKINTLYKVEAERVVAVYHHYHKLAKLAAEKPQVVVQQQTVDPLEQLKKLAELKELGILTEDEFAQKKADLLSKL